MYTGIYRSIRISSMPHVGAGAARPSAQGLVKVVADTIYGGKGRIAGTVKIDSTPDYPAWRRVRLFVRRDGTLVAEQWSDPVTGAYSFEGITMAVEFTVIAYDHTGAYNAVVRDGVVAEPIP